MRLERAVLEARTLRERAIQTFAGALLGGAPDVFRVHMHRADLFGGPYGETTHDALRGPSGWSVGERESFAAAISRAHACAFCTDGHTAIGRSALAREGADWTPDEPERAPPRVRAAHHLLAAIAADEDLAKPIEALRAAGASDAEIEDVIDVAASFTIINRMADALRFELPSESAWRRAAPVILRMGYRAPGWTPPEAPPRG